MKTVVQSPGEAALQRAVHDKGAALPRPWQSKQRLYRVVPEPGPQRAREELDGHCAEHGLCHIKSTCEGEKQFRTFS